MSLSKPKLVEIRDHNKPEDNIQHRTYPEMNIIETKTINETFIDLYLPRMRATKIQQKPEARQLQQRNRLLTKEH